MDILKLNQFLGEGHACGYGDIKNINRFDVYNIDNIPTIFTHIVKTHNIDINNDVMTVKEFILLSENSYPGDIIKRLKASYGCV